MNKPIPKKEVAVEWYDEKLRVIYFWTTDDALTEFVEYGNVAKTNEGRNKYFIHVDPRYDFGEVLRYIQNYG